MSEPMVDAEGTIPLVRAEHVSRHYRLPRETVFGAPPLVHALSDVSFTLQRGRSLGVVGESGSGKSTLARLVMALEKPDAGHVLVYATAFRGLPESRYVPP